MASEDLHILDIAENDRWVTRAADVMQAAVEQAIRLRGRCRLGLSGGSTPAPVFEELASRPIEWNNVDLVQVDERLVPAGTPERNLTNQQAAFADTEATWFPLPVDQLLAAIAANPDEPAERADVGLNDVVESTPWVNTGAEPGTIRDVLADFDAGLEELAGSPPILDVVHLGLGADGHTASLFPGDPAVNELLHYSAVTAQENQDTRRVTLTRPILDRSRMAVWLVRGADKSDALGSLLKGDMTIPAGLIRPAHSVILADAEAASQR